jgi:hypothetical protein
MSHVIGMEGARDRPPVTDGVASVELLDDRPPHWASSGELWGVPEDVEAMFGAR